MEVSTPCQVKTLRELLKEVLKRLPSGERGSSLVNVSACSDGERVLRDEEFLPESKQIAFLPPVCGG